MLIVGIRPDSVSSWGGHTMEAGLWMGAVFVICGAVVALVFRRIQSRQNKG